MSCQQLAGNSKYRRVEAKGIGTVRVRAYANGPATKVSPVLVTTQISRGKAKKVTYKLDGRKLKAKRGRPLEGRDHAAEAERVGIHMLKATVKGKKKKAKAKVLTLKLKTVPCKTLFTAQRWRRRRRRPAAAHRRALGAQGVAFKVAKPLLPRQVKQAPHDRLHARVRRRPERPQALLAQARQEGQEDARWSRAPASRP